jgi:hypothetical protein
VDYAARYVAMRLNVPLKKVYEMDLEEFMLVYRLLVANDNTGIAERAS